MWSRWRRPQRRRFSTCPTAPFDPGPVHVYYINDSSTVGDQYTTAIGDDVANDGKSADKPMATLSALLARYTLGAGDIVDVDTGIYKLTNNVVFTAADSVPATASSG